MFGFRCEDELHVDVVRPRRMHLCEVNAAAILVLKWPAMPTEIQSFPDPALCSGFFPEHSRGDSAEKQNATQRSTDIATLLYVAQRR